MTEQGACVVVNTRSRRGQEWIQTAVRSLEARGVHVARAVATARPEQFADAVRAGLEHGLAPIIAGGGDGTLSAAANILAGQPTPLGVLPLGTGNQFAYELGIPADPEAAAAVVAGGRVERVDLGVINGRYFLTTVTAGVSARAAFYLESGRKRRLGRLAYLPALLKAVIRARPFNVTLRTDVGVYQCRTLQVVLGNGRYHAGPFVLAPEATIQDQRLGLYMVEGGNRRGLLRLVLQLPSGRQGTLPEVYTQALQSGELEAQPQQRLDVDGELSLCTPARFSVAPGALAVLAPPDFDPLARTPK